MEYSLNATVPTFEVIDKATGEKIRVDDRTFDPELHEKPSATKPAAARPRVKRSSADDEE